LALNLQKEEIQLVANPNSSARNCTKRYNKIQIRVNMIIKPDDLCSPRCYVHIMMKLAKLA
jgi:hypothetical protein